MYLLALASTLLVEVPVYVLAVTVASRWRVAAVAVGINLLTHPLLWWVLSGSGPAPLTFAVAEAMVCLVEAALLVAGLRVRWPVAGAAAVAANAASVLVGVLVLG